MKTSTADSIMKKILGFDEWVEKYRKQHYMNRKIMDISISPSDEVFRKGNKLPEGIKPNQAY